MSHLIYKIRQLYVNVFAEEVVLVVCSFLAHCSQSLSIAVASNYTHM